MLTEVLESGAEALVDGDLDVWIGVVEAYNSLLTITEDTAADAQAAGMSLESLTQLDLDIYPVIEDVRALEAGRPAADISPATEVAVLEPTQTSMPSAGQDELKDEWGRVFSATEVMTEVCIVVHETNMDFLLGDISLDRARTELAAEDGFIAFVRGILAPPSDRVAPYQEKLEAAMAELTKILEWEPGAIGTATTMDALDSTCISIQGLLDTIVAEAEQAGLSSQTLSEPSESDTIVVDDLWYQTKRGPVRPV